MRYILNSAVITSPGKYSYRLIDPKDIRAWLRLGECRVCGMSVAADPGTAALCSDRGYHDSIGPVAVSCIGYEETADALSQLAGVSIPVSRLPAVMMPGDTALVFRLRRRVEDPAKKGRMSLEFVLENSEVGILEHLIEES